MTDEQMARLQSKQEELGVGSTDLILFDGGHVRIDDEEEPHLDGLWERPGTLATTEQPPLSLFEPLGLLSRTDPKSNEAYRQTKTNQAFKIIFIILNFQSGFNGSLTITLQKYTTRSQLKTTEEIATRAPAG